VTASTTQKVGNVNFHADFNTFFHIICFLLRFRAYCEATSIHGFAYWVAAPRLLEKLFWVVVVIIGFVCASLIINKSVDDWQKHPGVVMIKTFSKVYMSIYNRFSVMTYGIHLSTQKCKLLFFRFSDLVTRTE
jgi:formate-dependent nitrite reductase membrane component NrfD